MNRGSVVARLFWGFIFDYSVIMAYQYIEQLPSESRIRYGEKITVAKLNIALINFQKGCGCDDPGT